MKLNKFEIFLLTEKNIFLFTENDKETIKNIFNKYLFNEIKFLVSEERYNKLSNFLGIAKND